MIGAKHALVRNQKPLAPSILNTELAVHKVARADVLAQCRNMERIKKNEGKRTVGQVELARRDGENVLDLLLNA